MTQQDETSACAGTERIVPGEARDVSVSTPETGPETTPEPGPVSPAEPNGYKFEQLVLDMVRELDSCLPVEVERTREFAPIKNKTGIDSVESARELCLKNGIEL